MPETHIELTKPIEDMTKDELREFALGEHGIELDMTKKRTDLIAEVSKLQKAAPVGAEKEPEPVAVKAKATHLKHPANGRVFVATEHLLKRGDMLPCDADGKLV